MSDVTSDLDTYCAIRERDTDLVLVMALRASEDVRGLFARSVEWDHDQLIAVSHSHSTRDGREVDVQAIFGLGAERRILHIENKIDAMFQPYQAESYAERVARLREEEDIGAAACLLFCPADFAEASIQTQTFDAVVTYEDVRDTLSELGPWGSEAALILEHAILQYRRGGISSPDDPIRTDFFARLAADAADRGLPTMPPVPRKAQAGFLWFPRDATLTQPNGWRLAGGSQGAWLVSKVLRGTVDIELSGIGRRVALEAVRNAYEGMPYALKTTKTSALIRARAQPLAPDESYEEQIEAVTSVLDTLVAVRSWWESDGVKRLESVLAG